MSNITQVVNADKTMTTLKKGMKASGLDQVLSGTGPFTVFAPSDEAFAKLENGMIEALLQPENKVKLIHLLRKHIVPGKWKLTDLKDGLELNTIDGKALSLRVADSKISIGTADVTRREITSSNGMVYSLGSVLVN